MEWGWGEVGKKDEEVRKYKLVVTEYSWGCKVQHGKYSSQTAYMYDPWTWSMVWRLPEGVGDLGEVKRGEKLGQL